MGEHYNVPLPQHHTSVLAHTKNLTLCVCVMGDSSEDFEQRNRGGNLASIYREIWGDMLIVTTVKAHKSPEILSFYAWVGIVRMGKRR